MVVYDLICEASHGFEGWFKSSEDFTQQQSSGFIVCPTCESTNVRKLPTASYISTPKNAKQTQRTEMQQELKVLHDLKNYIVSNSDDVGNNFVEEAKKIHYGEIEPRNIRGLANKEEVKSLSDEGIKIFHLPGTVTDKKKLN